MKIFEQRMRRISVLIFMSLALAVLAFYAVESFLAGILSRSFAKAIFFYALFGLLALPLIKISIAIGWIKREKTSPSEGAWMIAILMFLLLTAGNYISHTKPLLESAGHALAFSVIFYFVWRLLKSVT